MTLAERFAKITELPSYKKGEDDSLRHYMGKAEENCRLKPLLVQVVSVVGQLQDLANAPSSNNIASKCARDILSGFENVIIKMEHIQK